MAAVASVVFFAVALILNLAGISHGHVDSETFMLAGMLCLALAAVLHGWPGRP